MKHSNHNLQITEVKLFTTIR